MPEQCKDCTIIDENRSLHRQVDNLTAENNRMHSYLDKQMEDISALLDRLKYTERERDTYKSALESNGITLPKVPFIYIRVSPQEADDGQQSGSSNPHGLAAWRKAKNMTQYQLAKELNLRRKGTPRMVTYQMIGRWEHGMTPDPPTLKLLAEIFDCSVDDLI